MLKNDAFDAKIGVDTAANEPQKWSEISKTRKKSKARKTLKNDALDAKIDVDIFL